MSRAEDFARDLYLFLFKTQGLNPDPNCKICSNIEVVSPSDFKEDIGKAVLMLSCVYRWQFRKSVHDSCLTDEKIEPTAEQCRDQLYSYALVFSSVLCEKPDVFKILVICSFISEVYLFLFAYLGCNGKGIACSYLEQARTCFVNIFESVIRKNFDEECLWRDLGLCAQKIASGYDLFQLITNTENVLSDSPSPLMTTTVDSLISEDDDSISEVEAVSIPLKSDSVFIRRNRKCIWTTMNKYRNLYKLKAREEFTPIEHFPASRPVHKSRIVQNVSQLEKRFEHRDSLEASNAITSWDHEITNIALDENKSNEQLTHDSSLEFERRHPEINSHCSNVIAGKDGLNLRDQCNFQSEEQFTHSSVKSYIPAVGYKGNNAKMGGHSLIMQGRDLKLEEQINISSDIEVISNIHESNSQSLSNASTGTYTLNLRERCISNQTNPQTTSDIEVKSNIHEMNSQSFSCASTGTNSLNLQERCIANQTNPQTTDFVTENTVPLYDVSRKEQISSVTTITYRLISFDPVNSRAIWLQENSGVVQTVNFPFYHPHNKRQK